MSDHPGTKFDPGNFDRGRKRRGGAVWAWALSLAAHGSLLMGMGFVGHLPNKQAPPANARKGEIVLVARWADREKDTSRNFVSFTTRVNRAPELIPPARQAMFDPQVAPAAAAMPTQPPQRMPIQATSKTASPAASAAAGPSATETQVFGIRSRGARFVYVFDRSASMEGGLLSAAKRELIASLQELDSRHQFQIIFYNDQPQLMPALHGRAARMAFADAPGKRLAADFINGVFADGGTKHLQALELALSLKPDVIFFLTDAEEPQMRPAELAAVQRMNRGTQINTIEFGAGVKKPVVNFLQILAAENAGQHAYVDVRLLRVER